MVLVCLFVCGEPTLEVYLMLGFTQGAIIYIDNNVGEQTLRRSMSILLVENETVL